MIDWFERDFIKSEKCETETENRKVRYPVYRTINYEVREYKDGSKISRVLMYWGFTPEKRATAQYFDVGDNGTVEGGILAGGHLARNIWPWEIGKSLDKNFADMKQRTLETCKPS